MEVLKQVLLFTVSLYMNIIVLLIFRVQFSVLLPYFCEFVKFTHRIYICTEMNKWTYQLSSSVIWFVSFFFWNSFDSQLPKEEEATAQLQVTIGARIISEHFAYLVLPKQKIKGGNFWQKNVGSITTGPYKFWAGFLLNPLPANAKILCQGISNIFLPSISLL